MKSVKDYEDEGKLSTAERALIAAVRAGEDCILSTTRPDTATDANTIRADLLAVLIRGGTPNCELHPEGVKVRGAYIEGSLILTQRHAVGDTWLLDCFFDSVLEMRGAKLMTLALDGSLLDGVNAQGIVVAQDLSLRGIKAFGTIDLGGARIHGQLSFKRADLRDTNGLALNLQSAKIGESLFLDNIFAKGTIALNSTQIDGQLACINCNLDCADGLALNMQRTRVHAAFIWSGVKVNAGHVLLSAAHVGYLWDDVENWPNDLVLDGFTYDQLIDTTTSARDRLPWLAAGSYPKGQFTPQPYTQLAKVLREMGHDGEARIVLMERERLLAQNLYEAQRKEYLAALHGEQTQRADAGWIWISMMGARAWAALMRRVTGYGYAPHFALFWALGCVGLGTVLYFIGYAQGLMVPNSAVILTSVDWAAAFGADAIAPALEWKGQAAAHFETFYPIPYALDVFLPVVDLGQHAAWTQTTVTTWGVALRWFTWALQGAGYLITGLGLAAATGIIQKDRG